MQVARPPPAGLPGPIASADRAALEGFVKVGEQAKAAHKQGDSASAVPLLEDALRQGEPLRHIPHIPKALDQFSLSLKEARAALSAAPAPTCEFEAMIAESIVGSTGVRWDDVVGLEDAKRALWEAVVLPALNPELFSGLRQPPKGVLLYGPPGNGKTLLARAAAGECKATFFGVSASTLGSKWHGETEKIVRALFTVARARAPSIIFLDELDSVLSARSSSESETARRLKTEFLVQLEGVAGAPERLVVLGATNRPFDLDDAVLRRFTVRVHMPLPADEARAAALASLLSGHATSLTEADFGYLGMRTERFSYADLATLCREAAMGAIRELTAEQVAAMRHSDVRPVSVADFAEALCAVQPSVSAATVEELETWNQRK